ncbi:MAG: hypothetical protein OHK0029_07880 [Armatimonadaceae bacterium]
MQFPAVDPIPLPAPVWLMKGLGLLTLALHFVAVFLLLGGLTLAIALNFRGMRPGGSAARDVSYAIARRLPVVMTYVINLGIPPLLFAQVLYGRALYTSTVLIGVLWIAIIPLLTLGYWLLYRMSDRIANGKLGAVYGLGSLLIAVGIAQIFSFNMTLMLRPEVWHDMYSASALGLQAPKDPTVTPRWLFMLTGGMVWGGLGTLLLANLPNLSDDVRRLMQRLGGLAAAIAGVVQIGLGFWVQIAQPTNVQQAVLTHPFYGICGWLFLATAGLTLLLAGAQAFMNKPNLPLTLANIVTGFLAVCGAVLYRDGIRDMTLLAKGFDVWDRTVVSNWSVIGLFLGLFVIGLVVVGWLISVVAKATPEEEHVAM